MFQPVRAGLPSAAASLPIQPKESQHLDVHATALYAKLGVEDLEQLDPAYSPQFNSAKGPVIMAGFVAANVLRGDVHTIRTAALRQKLAILPVRRSNAGRLRPPGHSASPICANL